MSEQQPGDRTDAPPAAGGSDKAPDAKGYFKYLTDIFTDTDRFFDDSKRGLKIFGLINMGALIVLLAFASFFQRIGAGTGGGVRFAWLLNGIKTSLAIAVPLGIALFVLNWYSGRQGTPRGLDFFTEKLGAALALPAVLILIAIPLSLIGATVHSWFRGAAMMSVYIAIFMMAYLYAAPRRLQVATVFALGFYATYRLILLLL